MDAMKEYGISQHRAIASLCRYVGLEGEDIVLYIKNQMKEIMLAHKPVVTTTAPSSSSNAMPSMASLAHVQNQIGTTSVAGEASRYQGGAHFSGRKDHARLIGVRCIVLCDLVLYRSVWCAIVLGCMVLC